MRTRIQTCVPAPKWWPEKFTCRICERFTNSFQCLPPRGLFKIGHCRRCGVMLVDPNWIQYGYGPRCWRLIQDEVNR